MPWLFICIIPISSNHLFISIACDITITHCDVLMGRDSPYDVRVRSRFPPLFLQLALIDQTSITCLQANTSNHIVFYICMPEYITKFNPSKLLQMKKWTKRKVTFKVVVLCLPHFLGRTHVSLWMMAAMSISEINLPQANQTTVVEFMCNICQIKSGVSDTRLDCCYRQGEGV